MAGITSTGLGSGLDINSIVTQLVAAERDPQIKRMAIKEAALQSKISALGSIKSAMSDFKTSLSALRYGSQLNKISATSSDTGTLTATAFTNADPANYQMDVQQLALSHGLSSQAYASASTVVGTGTLSIRFGTTSYDVGNNPTGFSPNAQKAALNITIDSNHQTLGGIRDAINAANGGVTASIINDGTGNRLVLNSTDSGAANSLEITGTGSLTTLSYNAASHPMAETQRAQDALLKINGLNITSASNTVSTAIKGLTLNLQQAQPGKLVNLSVGQNNDDIVTAVQGFVDKYNAFATSIQSVSGYDTATKTAGALLGESTARAALSGVRNMLSTTIQGLTGSVRSLPDIGIKTQADGTLAVNTSILNSALTKDHNGVVGLFAVSGIPSDSSVIYSGSTTDTLAGTYAVDVTTIAEQAIILGTAAPSMIVDATNNAIQVSVNGVTSGTINLTNADYSATPDQLAAELQTQINGDSALKAAGVSVTVGYDSLSGKFSMNSQTYGSASTIQLMSITGGGTDIAGLTAGQLDAGVDIVGTIGGFPSTGVGQTLTVDSGDAKGLSTQVTDSVIGAHGTLQFSRGLIEQLDTLTASFLNDGGSLDSKISGLQDTISVIGKQQAIFNKRMDALQESLFKKFNAMDRLLGSLQNTAGSLTQMLASLPLSVKTSSR
ncbi:MAG: flagellar filament capping protein FliD [Gammaproteobacteria bacterium]|nr:flagellar filament capping protein FliD [Gammaproteobacteria bacterium]